MFLWYELLAIKSKEPWRNTVIGYICPLPKIMACLSQISFPSNGLSCCQLEEHGSQLWDVWVSRLCTAQTFLAKKSRGNWSSRVPWVRLEAEYPLNQPGGTGSFLSFNHPNCWLEGEVEVEGMLLAIHWLGKDPFLWFPERHCMCWKWPHSLDKI